MRRNRLRPGDDALSPVVGAVLLVGIAVILMGVVGAFVFGFGFAGEPPESDVQFTQSSSTTTSGFNVTITVVDPGGLQEDEVHVEVDGQDACMGPNRPWSGSGSLDRGEEVEIDGYGSSCSPVTPINANQTVTVIWREEGGDQSHIVGEFVTI